MSLETKVHAVGTGQVRLFIAVPVPDEVRATLRAVQDGLKEVLPRHSAAWTRSDGLHLTLRFLGNVDAMHVPDLSQRLSGALAGFGGIGLMCERLGCFPDLRLPRVVWAWVHDDADALVKLFHRVDEAVSEFAEKPAEKGFTGHITLARLKYIRRHDAEWLARFVEGAVQQRFGEWTAQSVSLIQSYLSQTGATYTELCCANLR